MTLEEELLLNDNNSKTDLEDLIIDLQYRLEMLENNIEGETNE